MENKYDYALMQYVSNDILRPTMNMPRTINNYVFASDSCAIIKIQKEKTSKNYNSDKFPNTAKFFNENITFKNSFETERLISILARFKRQYKKDDCIECSGSGEVECECCGNEKECKVCSGTGDSDKIHNLLLKEFDSGKFIKLSDVYFFPVQLNRLLETALLFRQEKIFYFNDMQKEHTIFRINDFVTVLIMHVKGGLGLEHEII